jgi:ribosomal protein S18 acetylase RimI-like enzyme
LAVPEDLPALERLEAECFDASVAISHRQFRYLLRAPSANIYVLRQGSLAPAGAPASARGPGGEGDVAADAIVLRRRDRRGVTARLYSLAVSPEHRGKGLGRTLLCHCLDVLRGEHVEVVALEVAADNVPAIALYESLGFLKTRRLTDYYGPGEDGWRMRLTFARRS